MADETPKEELKEVDNSSSIELKDTVDKLQEQLDRKEALLRREEELAARRLLGGKSEQIEEPKKVEESAAEYTRRVEREIAAGRTDFN